MWGSKVKKQTFDSFNNLTFLIGTWTLQIFTGCRITQQHGSFVMKSGCLAALVLGSFDNFPSYYVTDSILLKMTAILHCCKILSSDIRLGFVLDGQHLPSTHLPPFSSLLTLQYYCLFLGSLYKASIFITTLFFLRQKTWVCHINGYIKMLHQLKRIKNVQ